MTTASQIIAGPAIIKYKSAVLYSEGDIKLDNKLETFKLKSAAYGELDSRYKQITTELSFKPTGAWNANTIAALWPYLNPVMGLNLFANADELIIHTFDGQSIEVPNCIVSQMPSLKLSATSTMIGDVTFRSYGSANWNTARFNVTPLAFADTSYDLAEHLTIPYTGQWGASAPWDNFEPGEGGFEIAFSMSTNPHGNDSQGTITELLTGVTCEAKVSPVGVTSDHLMALLNLNGSGVRRGGRMATANAATMIIQGELVGDPKFSLPLATPTAAPILFGAESMRAGECVFSSERTLTAGVAQPILQIGEVAA